MLCWCSEYGSLFIVVLTCLHWGNHPGHYSVEKLIEMIGLHLDATYADSHIWKEFASCFLKHPQCDEDKMSTCVNSYGESYTKRVKNVPDLFRDNLSRRNWRLRCRWWLTRHFTKTRLASEVSSGSFSFLLSLFRRENSSYISWVIIFESQTYFWQNERVG